MNYNVKLPDDSVNIPKESILLQATKLTFFLIIIISISYTIVTVLVYLIIKHITPEQEKQLFKHISFGKDIYQDKNPYLDNITKQLSKCTNIPYDVTIFINSEKSINAYALPGGVIYITKGMLNEIKNENELAFVIGHEIGHFKNRDHLKGIGKSLVLLVISSIINNNILDMTFNASNAKYSQSVELSADRVGLELLNCVYGSVSGATELFERIGKGENRWKFFLASHPSFNERIEKMKEFIKEKNMDITKPPVPLKVWH